MSEFAATGDQALALRAHLVEAGYATDRLEQMLGGGRISFAAADREVHERRLKAGEPLSAFVRLFILGDTVPAADAESALAGLDVGALARAGWLKHHECGLRATVKLVPHGELLIASDCDTEGPNDVEWVAGVHPPSVTLAKLSVRRSVSQALDVGRGNGIQALLASRHAEAVVAIDVNARALAVASLNADLNGVSNIEFRHGSYFEPVAGECFDVITCNPPYVISPERQYAYRDSGLAGDTVSRRVVQQAAEHLSEGGFAHLLINWAHPPDDPWSTLERWVDGRGCDSWLLHFGSDDPLTYAAAWLEPLARNDPERFRDELDRWLAYLGGFGIEAIAHGAVVLRRRSGGRNWTRRDGVMLDRLEVGSEHIQRVFRAQDYLESLDDERGMLDACFALVDNHHLEQTLACRNGRPELQTTVLSLDEGLGFRTGLDLHTTRLVPLLDGSRSLRKVLGQRCAEMGVRGEDASQFEDAAIPVVRRLLQLGLLVLTDATGTPS